MRLPNIVFGNQKRSSEQFSPELSRGYCFLDPISTNLTCLITQLNPEKHCLSIFHSSFKSQLQEVQHQLHIALSNRAANQNQINHSLYVVLQSFSQQFERVNLKMPTNICQQLQIKSYKMTEKYCFKTRKEQMTGDFQKELKAIYNQFFI